MRVLDLFSGIGAFSLGLERAGMQTISFCEIDPFCRRVLAKHWPEVHCYPDVRELSAQHLTADGHGDIDLICGGFPCQDISVAGRGAGLAGERSGLWSEFARLIGEIRPRYAIVENVAALLGRGLGTVLGDLAALGYDAEWHCIPAAAVGAPHIRDRVWIVAYASSAGRQQVARGAHGDEGSHEGRSEKYDHQLAGYGEGNGARPLADAIIGSASDRNAGSIRRRREAEQSTGRSSALAHPNDSDEYRRRRFLKMGRLPLARKIAVARDAGRVQWGAEPDVGRVAHGVASRVDRLRGLGNSLVPQIPELIGRAIMAAEAEMT